MRERRDPEGKSAQKTRPRTRTTLNATDPIDETRRESEPRRAGDDCRRASYVTTLYRRLAPSRPLSLPPAAGCAMPNAAAGVSNRRGGGQRRSGPTVQC